MLNRVLDQLVRPEVYLFRQRRSAFQIFGLAGLALAILLAYTLAWSRGLSLGVMAAVTGVGVLTLLGLAMTTKIITGRERLTYYHHEIAILLAIIGLLLLLRQPVLPYLDVAVLGVGAFLTCGRLGCLMVGCCYGRPFQWGACYSPAHARAGFPRYLVGVRLLPVQAVESIWVAVTVLAGSGLVLAGAAPGTALAWYVVAYDLGRFSFEFLRGDADRPYYRSFSEAQWTSLLLMAVVVGAELAGVLPFYSWHAGLAVLPGLVMAGLALYRRFGGETRYQLLHARHIKEVAQVVNPRFNPVYPGLAVPSPAVVPAAIPVSCTSLGLQISLGQIEPGTAPVYQYTLSSQYAPLTRKTAAALAGLILHLAGPSGAGKLIEGRRGVFHLLIQPQEPGLPGYHPPG